MPASVTPRLVIALGVTCRYYEARSIKIDVVDSECQINVCFILFTGMIQVSSNVFRKS